MGKYSHKTDSRGLVLQTSETVQELMALGDYIVYLADVDCFLYDRVQEKTVRLNGETADGEKENVKTLYFNKEMEAIVMIYTCEMDPRALCVRSVALDKLGEGYRGDEIFSDYNFYFPDFI